MKKFITLLILVPVGIVVVALSVANRQNITLSVPPQVGDAPLYSFDLPLYAVLFAALFVGVLIGSCATWFSQGKHRKSARENKIEATKLGFETQQLKEKVHDSSQDASDESKALRALGLPAPSRAA